MDQPDRIAPPSNGTGGWLNRTLVGADITSGLGDFCYETTTVILPGFLAVLGLPAAALGTIEGIADAVASFTKMVSGHIADKLGHRKRLVLVGYALTPVGQALIALATGWPPILMGRMVSWFGKGLRGPLRDAVALAFVFQVQTVPLLAVIFSVAGLYMAVQEALESTVTAEMVDTATLATGIGVLGTVNGVAKFVSSTAVGLLWTGVSPLAGFGGAAALMAAGTVALLAVDRRGT